MQVITRKSIRLRVYERGSGETLSCGTGACAAVVSGILQGLLDSEVTVQMKGGTLRVNWNGPFNISLDKLMKFKDVVLTGPAVAVYKGEIFIQ